jgi:hypothetical protein
MTYHAIHSGLIVARRFSNKSNMQVLNFHIPMCTLDFFLLPTMKRVYLIQGKVINLYPGLIL